MAKNVGGTVVKKASCQGDQYLYLGHDTAFQMNMSSAVNNTLAGVSCFCSMLQIGKILTELSSQKYLTGLGSCLSDR